MQKNALYAHNASHNFKRDRKKGLDVAAKNKLPFCVVLTTVDISEYAFSWPGRLTLFSIKAVLLSPTRTLPTILAKIVQPTRY